MILYSSLNLDKNSDRNLVQVINDDFKLKSPLKTKGRPCNRLRRASKRRGVNYISPLDILFSQKILTFEQFKAGQIYAYLVRYIHKNIPLPQFANNTYQEKIKGGIWEFKDQDEKCLKNFFTLWHHSIMNLKRRGKLPKFFLEGFLDCLPQEIDSLSIEDIRNIQQALNHLACFYTKIHKTQGYVPLLS